MNVGDDFVGSNAWLRGVSKLCKDLRETIYDRDKTPESESVGISFERKAESLSC